MTRVKEPLGVDEAKELTEFMKTQGVTRFKLGNLEVVLETEPNVQIKMLWQAIEALRPAVPLDISTPAMTSNS